MGVRWRTTSTCPAGHASERDAPSTVIELLPPPPQAQAQGQAPPSFAAALQATLSASSRTKGWCEGCKAYVQLSQLRVAASLPPLLCVSAGGLGGGGGAAAVAAREMWAGGAAAAAKAAAAAAAAVASGGARRIVPATPWVPPLVHVRLTPAEVGAPAGVAVTEAGTPSAAALPAVPPNAPGEALYCVVGVLCLVSHPPAKAAAAKAAKATAAAALGKGGSKAGAATSAAAAAAAVAVAAASSGGGASATAVLRQYHYVACARVGPEGALLPSAAPALHAPADWLVFNHFRVTPAPAAEVRACCWMMGMGKMPRPPAFSRPLPRCSTSARAGRRPCRCCCSASRPT